MLNLDNLQSLMGRISKGVDEVWEITRDTETPRGQEQEDIFTILSLKGMGRRGYHTHKGKSPVEGAT